MRGGGGLLAEDEPDVVKVREEDGG